jgi:protein subunit release factor A
MADPAVISDGEQYRKVSKRTAIFPKSSQNTATTSRRRKRVDQAKAMLDESDPDMREMARLEIERSSRRWRRSSRI